MSWTTNNPGAGALDQPPEASPSQTQNQFSSQSMTDDEQNGVLGGDYPPDDQIDRQFLENSQLVSARMTTQSACTQCRAKHLKCDGLSPCTRCASNDFPCEYVRSRRGFKGPRRNGSASQSKSSPTAAISSASAINRNCPMISPSRSISSVSMGLMSSPDHQSQALPLTVDLPPLPIGQDLVAFEPKHLPPGLDLRDRCIEAFFYHFFPAHPFTLPRQNYLALVRQDEPLGPLEAAMRYVGSFYVPQAPSVALGIEAEQLVYDSSYPKSGFLVQAMLVLAVGLDGYTYQEKALKILVDAQDLAIGLGMNKQEFALLNGRRSSTLEESWRRTWWELYVVDGMIAGVHQKSNFRMQDVPADVALPCEEKEFVSGDISPSHSMKDFDNESFDGRDFTYSSFAYRIVAIRNLGKVLSSRQLMLPDEATMNRIDAHLVNWRLHLPKSKKDFITSDGELDEMLFQAHMITNATTVLLHREHSELDSSVARNVTSCAPHKSIVPGQSYNIHAAKTIQAAQDISKLIQLPVPLIKHTHFFTCVVTLASIVHLSCWSALMPIMQDDDIKQQLRLNTGALKTLWQVWPSAGKAFGQVKGVAQEIYAAKKQAAEVGFWASLTHEEVMRGLITDQSIMEELQLLN